MTAVFHFLLVLSLAYSAYSDPNQSWWQSSISTMLQLRESVAFSYSGANLFLDLIRGDDPPAVALKSYVNVMTSSDSRISFRTIQPIVVSYVGFGTCVVLGILFALLVPLVGLIFCCARCCGKCGGRVKLMDSKKDPCKRAVYALCVVVIVTIQLVAIVLAFINHFLLHEALVNRDPQIGAFSQLNTSLFETETALREMFKTAVNSSSPNVDDGKARFMGIVDGGLIQFQRDFIRNSHAERVMISIDELRSTVRDFRASSEPVSVLKYFNDSLVHLIHELPSIRREITESLDPNCPLKLYLECSELMRIAQTKLEVRYEMEQFQSEELSSLLDLLQRQQSNVDGLKEFNNTLNNLASTVKRSVEGDLDRAWTDVASSPSMREKLASSFSNYLDVIYVYLHMIVARLDRNQNFDHQAMFFRLVEFRLYGGIALLCVPVLIFLLVYLGLCFGSCGHRPYEEAGFCNRGVAANLLLAGVGFVFLFSTILMIVCTLLFLPGGALQTEICRYLTDHVPDGPRKLDDYTYESVRYVINSIRREEKIRQHRQPHESTWSQSASSSSITSETSDMAVLEFFLNVSRARMADAILTRCKTEPFVDAISGGQLAAPVLLEPIQDILKQLIVSFKGVDLIRPLENTVKQQLRILEEVNFLDSVNFTKAISQVDLPLTHIDDLEGFVTRLRNLHVNELEPHLASLEKYALSLDKLRPQARHLYVKLDSLPGQRQQLQRQLVQFHGNLSDAVKNTMDAGLIKLQPLLEHELQLALMASWRGIPCRSLRLAVKRGVDAVCITALMPWNALWAALGLTLWLFIPLIIFAVKLAGLYRKTEKYSSDYEEPDYISYHGFYMRSSGDYRPASKKQRDKTRQNKAKPNVNDSQKHKGLKATRNSRYHQVSVYPYDAYE